MSPVAGLGAMYAAQNQGLAPLATLLGPSGANAKRLKKIARNASKCIILKSNRFKFTMSSRRRR